MGYSVRLAAWVALGFSLVRCAEPSRAPVQAPVQALPVQPPKVVTSATTELVNIIDEELPPDPPPPPPKAPYRQPSFSVDSFHAVRADLTIFGTAFGRPILRAKTGLVEITQKRLVPRPELVRGIKVGSPSSFFGRWPGDAYAIAFRGSIRTGGGPQVYKWTGGSWSLQPGGVLLAYASYYKTPRGQLAQYAPGAYGERFGGTLAPQNATLRGEPKVDGFSPHHLEMLSDGDVLTLDLEGKRSLRWTRTSHQLADVPDSQEWLELIARGTRAVARTSQAIASYDGKSWTSVALPIAQDELSALALEEDGTLLCTLRRMGSSSDHSLWRKAPKAAWTKVADIHSDRCRTSVILTGGGSIWLRADCAAPENQIEGPAFTVTNHEARETYEE